MSILSEKMLGKPYRWAQDLCGLEFLNTSSTSTSTDRYSSSISNELVQLSVPKIVKQIRSRWQSRLQLQSQITALGMSSLHFHLLQRFRFVNSFLSTEFLQKIKTSIRHRLTINRHVCQVVYFNGLQSLGKNTAAHCRRKNSSKRM